MGSGGVGFLIKKALLNDFDVTMLDDTYEGILWLKLIHKQKGIVLYVLSVTFRQSTQLET